MMDRLQGIVDRHTPPEQYEALKYISETLEAFELAPTQARVYLYLARYGPVKAIDIAKATGAHRTHVHKKLGELIEMGLVSTMIDVPHYYFAVPFPEAMKMMFTRQQQKIRELEKLEKESLSLWASLPEPEQKEDRKQFILRVIEVSIRTQIAVNIEIANTRLYYLNQDSYSHISDLIPENDEITIHNKKNHPSFIILDDDLYIFHGYRENRRLVYFHSQAIVQAFKELYNYLEAAH